MNMVSILETSGGELPNNVDDYRSYCWDAAVHTFATAKIFNRRARLLRKRVRRLTFLGIVVPASVGSVVLSLGTDSVFISLALVAASVVATIQLVFSIWALSNNWHDDLGYSLESGAENNELSRQYQQLARNPPDDLHTFVSEKDHLDLRNRWREGRDSKQGVTPEELRAGHRQALFFFERTCPKCNKEPESLHPSDCDSCGNFPRRYVK